MSDIGVEIDKNCDYCGKPIMCWMGKPGTKGYHTGCVGKARYVRSKRVYNHSVKASGKSDLIT